MKTTDIDVLLKKSLSHELVTPPELEAQTWQKMNATPRRKSSIFVILLNILCFTFFALEMIVVLSYFDFTALKIIFLYVYLTTICFIVLAQIISNNINFNRIL